MPRPKKYNPGDIVRCTYRGVGWIGVVVGRPFQTEPHIYTVVPMIDKCGHPQSRKYSRTYSAGWLEPAELDESQIKRNWL